MNIKKVKWKKVHIADWTQKSPGRGAVLREEPPRRSGDLVWICVCIVQRGDFASGGVLLCFQRGISRRSGDWASRRESLPPFGGRPAGSCYLRLRGVLPEVVTSVRGTGRPAGSRYLRLGASCRKSLPPFGGRPAGSRCLRFGERPAGSHYLRSRDWVSCRKSLPPFGGRPAGSRYLRLGGVLPEGVPLLGEGASRAGYFVFCEMPVMRLMTKSCCSSVTTLSQ